MSHQHYSRWVTLASMAAVTTARHPAHPGQTDRLADDGFIQPAGIPDRFLHGHQRLSHQSAGHPLCAGPADEEHRFGHGKAESLAGLVQSAFISGSALLLVMHGISSMLNQVPVVRLEAGIWVSVGSIVLTLLLVSFQGFVIRKTNSVAIKADMLHYRSDLLLNGGVLVALVLAGQGVVLGRRPVCHSDRSVPGVGAVHIGYESVQALLDRQLPEEEQARIMALCCAVEGCMAYMTCVPANPGRPVSCSCIWNSMINCLWSGPIR